ncbi:MAG: GntR family transcriptional regulator [Alphaproteobacteria bacterium]|nr:GntR family transcriptional regulator [Alphaproteobacteria bacterium]
MNSSTQTIHRSRNGQQSAAEGIRQVLEDEIADGRLVPGARLEEVELAGRFGVSRTPVREALRMLSTSGLIELKQRKGAVVATLSTERLIELFEAMSELEAVCGRLAARRITEGELSALRVQLELCAAAATNARGSEEADAYYDANATFHSLIYKACHNDYLANEVMHLRRRLQPYRRLQLRMKGRIGESFAEHKSIVEAIADGDEVQVGDLLRNHVSVQGNRFADWLASVNAVYGAAAA